jgi:replicative DNA helicase
MAAHRPRAPTSTTTTARPGDRVTVAVVNPFPVDETFHIDYVRPYLYPKQYAAIYDQHRMSLIEASTKAGKAQPLDALVYTPSGPRPMGSLREGEHVLTPSGGRSRILAIYPQGRREILKVTFSDGSVVEADADHLWEIHQFKRRRPTIVTTEQLQAWPRSRLHRAWVTKIAPADFDEKPVPLDPYLVGALIGDGGMTGESVMFSNADAEVLAEVSAVLPAGHHLKHSSAHDWRITGAQAAAAMRQSRMHIRGIVERLGLGGKGSHEKFIPECYRYRRVSTFPAGAEARGM